MHLNAMSLHKLKIVLKRIALVTCIGVAILIVVMAIAGRDTPAPETGDLTLARVHLPPEDNAVTYYNAALKALYWPTNRTLVTDYLRGKEVAAGLRVTMPTPPTMASPCSGLPTGACRA